MKSRGEWRFGDAAIAVTLMVGKSWGKTIMAIVESFAARKARREPLREPWRPFGVLSGGALDLIGGVAIVIGAVVFHVTFDPAEPSFVSRLPPELLAGALLFFAAAGSLKLAGRR